MNARYWNGNTASKIDEFAWGALAAAQRLQSRSSSFAARVISAKTPLAPCGYCAAAERLRRVRHLHIAMMGEIKVEPSRGQQSRRFSGGPAAALDPAKGCFIAKASGNRPDVIQPRTRVDIKVQKG